MFDRFKVLGTERACWVRPLIWCDALEDFPLLHDASFSDTSWIFPGKVYRPHRMPPGVDFFLAPQPSPQPTAKLALKGALGKVVIEVLQPKTQKAGSFGKFGFAQPHPME